jgi:hypothetical protein
MKFSRIIGLLTFLISSNAVFSQEVIQIKNSSGVQLFINNDYSEVYSQDLKLTFEKTDTLLVEIQKDQYSVKKSIPLSECRSYEVLKTGDLEYKLRLRSNAEIENYAEIFLDTLKPAAVVNSSFLNVLEKQEFEFDKVNLLLTHLRENKVTNQNLSEYLKTIDHDFSKWQVLEVILNENLMPLDYAVISQTFDSSIYKERLKNLLESK